MEYLPLTFSATLQHYSAPTNTSFQKYYKTALHPTVNAVIGLLGAALGCPRGDSMLDELRQTLVIKWKCVPKENQNVPKYKNAPAVLVKPQTVITDFQSVKPLDGEKFIKLSQAAKGTKQKTSENSEKTGAGIIKTIEYIQDTVFEVFVGGDVNVLRKLHKALLNPCYALYFGKRGCVPNRPIVEVEFNTIKEEELTDVRDCT